MKRRRIKQNIWGNWKGYEGNRKVMDFGTDEIEAEAWRKNTDFFGELLYPFRDIGRRLFIAKLRSHTV